MDTTFASHDPRRQSYPGNYLTDNDPHTGRTDFNTLDYEDCSGTNDVYHLIYTFPHTAANVAIDFKAWGLQEINDESWGLDNVRVEYAPVPLPGSVLLLETGLLGLAGWRRFRKG